MRIIGERKDGAVHVSTGGVSIVLRGQQMSPPSDEADVEKLGPWAEATGNLLSRRREIEKRLNTARVSPLATFHLRDMSFDERRDRVMSALRTKLGYPSPGPWNSIGGDLWIPTNGIGNDWVVYCVGGKHYMIGYSVTSSGSIEFDGTAEEAVSSWETMAEDDNEQARDLSWYAVGKELADVPTEDLFELGDRSQYPDGKYPSEGGQTDSASGKSTAQSVAGKVAGFFKKLEEWNTKKGEEWKAKADAKQAAKEQSDPAGAARDKAAWAAFDKSAVSPSAAFKSGAYHRAAAARRR